MSGPTLLTLMGRVIVEFLTAHSLLIKSSLNEKLTIKQIFEVKEVQQLSKGEFYFDGRSSSIKLTKPTTLSILCVGIGLICDAPYGSIL